MSNSLVIRQGERADLPAIVDIYNHYVAETHITFDVEPTTVAARSEWFDDFAAHASYKLLVAEKAGRMVGYAHARSFRPKPAYVTSVETTVYLAPDAGGEGVGTALYLELFSALKTCDVHRAYGLIALPNEASIALHEKFGFKSVGMLSEVGRKFGRYYDVAWLEKKFVEGP